MEYRVVVDYFPDRFGYNNIEPVKEFDTLEEAEQEVKNLCASKHFDCHYEYYIQKYNYKKKDWKYVGKSPKLEYKISKIQVWNSGEKIKLPIKVTLTRSQIMNNNSAYLSIIKQLVDNWPK